MKNALGTLFVAVLALFSIAAYAQETKVVVIPMAGDDVKLEPFAPLASPSPPDSDYTINGNSPNPSDQTVIDKITGLEWQREDKDNVYRLWQEAWDYCAGLSLDGKNDWRLPSISELRSIVSYDRVSPAINPVFLNTNSYFYWSATSKASGGSVAWTVVFTDGNSGGWDKEEDGSLPVRCVRSGIPNGPVLRANEDGTVSDLATGLIWQQVDDDSERTWAAAQSYCDGLVLGGKKDWRLPNVKELESILDYRMTNPSIDDALFPSTNPSFYWSATGSTRILDASWRVDFYQGVVDFHVRSNTYSVRCVR